MSFLTAGYIGVLFVVYLLPTIAHKFTHAVYDSGEMVENDPMHDARALVAQGDYPRRDRGVPARGQGGSDQPAAVGGDRQDPARAP